MRIITRYRRGVAMMVLKIIGSWKAAVLMQPTLRSVPANDRNTLYSLEQVSLARLTLAHEVSMCATICASTGRSAVFVQLDFCSLM